MPSIVTTAHLQTKSKDARDKLTAIFNEITEYSRANEPKVLRYITCVPMDTANETSLYMVEEYADQAASDAHLQTAPVQKLLKHFEAEQPLAGAPEILNLSPSIDFRRPTATAATSSTLLILAHFGYQPGKTVHALEGWRSFVNYCEKK